MPYDIFSYVYKLLTYAGGAREVRLLMTLCAVFLTTVLTLRCLDNKDFIIIYQSTFCFAHTFFKKNYGITHIHVN